MDIDIFYILYDYKKYDYIHDLICKDNYINCYSLNIKYYEKLISNIPDKINKLIKLNIENILNKTDANNYDKTI